MNIIDRIIKPENVMYIIYGLALSLVSIAEFLSDITRKEALFVIVVSFAFVFAYHFMHEHIQDRLDDIDKGEIASQKDQVDVFIGNKKIGESVPYELHHHNDVIAISISGQLYAERNMN